MQLEGAGSWGVGFQVWGLIRGLECEFWQQREVHIQVQGNCLGFIWYLVFRCHSMAPPYFELLTFLRPTESADERLAKRHFEA